MARTNEPLSTARRLGLPRWHLGDLYHYFLVASWGRFFASIVVAYLVGNALFALGYWLDHGVRGVRSYADAYFFSVQTMATIGYGEMAPTGYLSHVMVTVEALCGLLGFSMATGVMFAKFSRPSARVMFTDRLLLTGRDGVPSLILRLANMRANQIVEAQLRVSALLDETTAEGERIRKLHDLALLRAQNPMFTITWTVVHAIDAHSPLAGMGLEEMRRRHLVIVVSLVGTDGTLMQTVHARRQYSPEEIHLGGRFADMFGGEGGAQTIDFGRFDEIVEDAASPGSAG